MSITAEEKDPDVPAEYVIDWSDVLVDAAPRSRDVAAGVFVRAQRDTGWYYECTVAGRTAAHYPDWPRAEGATVQDGSAQWTARHPNDSTIPAVQSAAWTVPAGITKDSQSEAGFLTRITLSGGTDGEDYEIICTMTPTVGNPVEQTIVVPVRAQ